MSDQQKREDDRPPAHLKVEGGADRDVYCNGERLDRVDGGLHHVELQRELDNNFTAEFTVGYDGTIGVGVELYKFPVPDPVAETELECTDGEPRPTFEGELRGDELLVEIVKRDEEQLVTDGGRDIDYDEPPEIPEPPMHPEWEDVETWSKANLRYPVPGGWEIADHGKFHTTWEHEDGTELSRTSKATPGQKDTFVFTVDGEEIHTVDTGPQRVEIREETVWLLQFYDENGIESVDEFEVEVRKERNQSLASFAGGDSDAN